MRCAKELCQNALPEEPVTSGRKDSIVYGLFFCSTRCRAGEAAIRKQKKRRVLGLDTTTRRRRDFSRKYDLSLEAWEALYAGQDKKCAICRASLEGRKICVDHCHNTGRVRGLLCTRCNQGLGYFSDDSETLVRASRYVGVAAATDLEEVKPS